MQLTDVSDFPSIPADLGSRLTVIAVQNYAGSGSFFLHSLFDSHPEALVLPGSFGIQYYVSYSIHLEHNAGLALDYQKLKGWVFTFFTGLFELAPGYELGLTELGKDMNETAVVDKNRFDVIFDHLVNQMARDDGLPLPDQIDSTNAESYRSVFLKAVYIAYEYCLGRDLSSKKFLIYPAHSAPMRDIGPLCTDFKRVKFVHMVREPVSNLDSMQRRLSDLAKERLPNIDVFSCVMHQILLDRAPQAPVCGVPLYSIYPYPTALPGASVAVRLEDLHRHSKAVLTALCGWLGMVWDDVLMTSTFAGKTWWNLPGLRRVTGFSTSIVSRKPGFNAFDASRIRALAIPISFHFQYTEPEEPRNSFREFAWLILCILPFQLEFKTLNFHRYRSLLPASFQPRTRIHKIAWTVIRFVNDHMLLFPVYFAYEYLLHRQTIVRGYLYNRNSTTKFVDLLEVHNVNAN